MCNYFISEPLEMISLQTHRYGSVVHETHKTAPRVTLSITVICLEVFLAIGSSRFTKKMTISYSYLIEFINSVEKN